MVALLFTDYHKVIKMKNDECTIYIITKNGSTQSFRKEGDAWKQTSSKGIVRSCTVEQVLSHILPPLAFGNQTLKVVPDSKNIK
jgi:hypothetical protein